MSELRFGSRRVPDARVARFYGSFGAWAGVAFWLDVTRAPLAMNDNRRMKRVVIARRGPGQRSRGLSRKKIAYRSRRW